MAWPKGRKQSPETCAKKKANSGMRTHGMYTTRFYKIWVNMRTRCVSKKNHHYHNYGGRGIKIEWESFEEFRDDMYKSYLEHSDIHTEKDTTIERIDSDRNYCKENCRWATRKEQGNNTRRNVVLEYKGEKLNLTQWSKKTGINYVTLRGRIRLGWSTEQILFEKPTVGRNQYKKLF